MILGIVALAQRAGAAPPQNSGNPANISDQDLHDEVSEPSRPPTAADGVVEEAEAAMRAGDFRRAVEKFSTAIELDPHNSVFYQERAEAYERTSQFDRAAQDRRWEQDVLAGREPSHDAPLEGALADTLKIAAACWLLLTFFYMGVGRRLLIGRSRRHTRFAIGLDRGPGGIAGIGSFGCLAGDSSTTVCNAREPHRNHLPLRTQCIFRSSLVASLSRRGQDATAVGRRSRICRPRRTAGPCDEH